MTKGKRTWRTCVRPIRIVGHEAFIALQDGTEAVIDATDVPLVSGWNWSAVRCGERLVYVHRGSSIGGGKSRPVKLHRLIMNAGRQDLVDHKDGDGLNNRRCNLRLTGYAGNARNRRKMGGTTSRFKGVSFRADRGTWLAQINVGGQVTKLGTFNDEAEAAAAYDRAAVAHFGEFARTNKDLCP